MARRKRPIQDTEYTGLGDPTVVGYSGSSTLDSSVDVGSPLPLVISSNRNQGISSAHNHFKTATYDLWDHPSPKASLMLSGVSDPPFASAGLSTPYPAAVAPGEVMSNAFQGLAKFGSGIATLLGNHPVTKRPVPSKLHGAQVGAVTVASVPSGSLTLGIVVVVVALGLLLINGTGGEL